MFIVFYGGSICALGVPTFFHSAFGLLSLRFLDVFLVVQIFVDIPLLCRLDV